MRPEHISDSLNHLSDEILEETDRVRSGRRPKKRVLWTAAACLCVMIAGALLLRPGGDTVQPGGELPLLEISMESGGMGFEGLLYYEFSELENGNPWHEGMELEALPVFRNGAYSEVGEPIGLSAKELEQRAESAARALGIEDFTIEQERGSYVASSITRVRLTGEGVRIDAEADGCVTVWFDDELALPEEYRFEYSDITSQEAEAVLDYLIGQYAKLLNFQQPQKAIFRDRNIYGELGVDYQVYNAAGDDVEDILNYAFRQADFAPDGEGKLMLIRLYDGLACAEQMGDYPLISLEEAREALLAGQYVTTVPYDFPGEAKVYGGELVYRGSAREQVFIPYYRFYVDLSHEFPNWDDTELKNFGAYYVPAIQHQYLKPGWQWDGSFN
ncbi:hypothetical protein D1646_14975 [Pseudoflavonifractor sp. 60]|uniref:hypothetical protein n=1 Tax=Pseudoflavonifractor sp. 60 TaxID=2304576 RepID=UPI0013684379|nr:hypothetical protein [Pseudoflavonifractor sp. 60]NBI68080.1 hypothetical protein [Pseudoflavonifractor sp. 60]